MIERISPPGAPAPRGPYSPAVRAGDFIFVSGQVAPVTGDVFLAEAGDFAAMNAVYAEFFGDAKPARATVVTGFAVPGIHVEIEAIAYKPR